MTTQTASLVTMDEATDKASVATFVEDVLAGSGWELQGVRRRSSRLDPPDWYWAQFDITINKEEEERRLRLVAKGALNIPVGDVARRMDELGDKTKPVVLYCASGMRSATAFGTLRRAGFVDVHDLGAMARWG